MKVSARARYGLRLMLTLALNYGKSALFLKGIAQQEEISEKYLSQIIISLRAKGLVNSIRGAHGGYTLARPPRKITVKEIVETLEGNLNIVECLDNPSACKRISFYVTRSVWSLLEEKIAGTLGGITLQDLVEMCREKEEKVLLYNI
jgi:Rrf2 family protein